MSHYYDSSLNLVWSNVELKPSILMGIIIFFSILHQIPDPVLDPVPDPVLDMVPHSIELKSNFLGWIAASLSFYDGSEYKLQFAKLNNILTRPRDRQTFFLETYLGTKRFVDPIFGQNLLRGKKFVNCTFTIRLMRMNRFILILTEKSSE